MGSATWSRPSAPGAGLRKRYRLRASSSVSMQRTPHSSPTAMSSCTLWSRSLPEPVFPDKRAVRRSFERAAAAYEGSAVLQREVGQRLIEHLDPIRVEPVRVLDLGCGTGQFFAPLGERFPRAQLVGLDLAHGMLLRARSRNAWWRRALDIRCARLVCADAERPPLPFARPRAGVLY